MQLAAPSSRSTLGIWMPEVLQFSRLGKPEQTLFGLSIVYIIGFVLLMTGRSRNLVSFNSALGQPTLPTSFVRATQLVGPQNGIGPIETPEQLYAALRAFKRDESKVVKEQRLEAILAFLKTDAGRQVPAHLERRKVLPSLNTDAGQQGPIYPAGDYPELFFDAVPEVGITIGVQEQQDIRGQRIEFPKLIIYNRLQGFIYPVYDSQNELNKLPVAQNPGLHAMEPQIIGNAKRLNAWVKEIFAGQVNGYRLAP